MSYTIHNGDCLEVLATIPENSVDTCITDPPYELGFMGKKWDSSGIAFQPETWQAVYRVLKPGALLLAFGGTRTYHRLVCAIEDAGFEIRDTIAWVYGSGFPKSYDISKGIDKQAGAEREVVESRKFGGRDGTSVTSGASNGGVQGGYNLKDNRNITAPSTPEAQLWHGWGTALKPAFEPIVVAMKPVDGNFVNNALTWGVAGMWIDGGRVEYEQGGDAASNPLYRKNNGYKTDYGVDENPTSYALKGEKGKMNINSQGRFPANFIHDGSDEVVECFPNDAQRFFYCAKASRSERNAGLEGMPIKQTVGGGGMNNTPDDVCGKYGSIKAPAQNHHPTVKPIELMRYLVRLTKTPTGGIVLDPFMGSGTTGIACELEGRDFIGIEREPEYIEIAEKRIAHYAMQPEQLRIE